MASNRVVCQAAFNSRLLRYTIDVWINGVPRSKVDDVRPVLIGMFGLLYDAFWPHSVSPFEMCSNLNELNFDEDAYFDHNTWHEDAQPRSGRDYNVDMMADAVLTVIRTVFEYLNDDTATVWDPSALKGTIVKNIVWDKFQQNDGAFVRICFRKPLSMI